MRFTRRAGIRRKKLGYKMRAIELLGGKVGHTNSPESIVMRQAEVTPAPEPRRCRTEAEKDRARLEYKLRRAEREARNAEAKTL
jgi:hypothetical protein